MTFVAVVGPLHRGEQPAYHGRAVANTSALLPPLDLPATVPRVSCEQVSHPDVDQLAQPGDGGWGLMLEAQGFWRLQKVWLFGSGNYLANPKDTNGTPSIISILEIPVAGQFAGLDVNSVPDQYVARAGAAVPLWRGFTGSLSWRMEGLRRYDLLGGSHGWRRPGTAMFVEPGISYAKGRHAVSFNMPIGYYYNRRPNPYTGIAGDATFPRHIFLSSYSVRLGGGGQ